MSQNNMRKEPTFGQNPAPADKNVTPSISTKQAPGFTFTPVERPYLEGREELAQAAPAAEKPAPVVEPAAEPEKAPVADKPEAPKSEAVAAERVIPAAAAAAVPEKPAAKSPLHNRRLWVVIGLVLLLGLAIWLLKPSTPATVEQLQEQQGNSLPIEFRPVDEAEAKRAEEEAKALQAAQEQQAQQAQANAAEQANQPAQDQAAAQAPEQPAVPAQTEQPSAPAQPSQASQTVEAPAVVRPNTQGSVIHQAETPRTEPKQVTRVTPPKEVKRPEPKPAAQPAAAKAPVKETAKPAPASSPAPAATGAVSSKQLTVPKGVSLMQVFRDNNLNISDVNAMTKANGAGSVLSSFKPGDKVTVRLDKNSRVAEMRLSNGGKFIRQANGTYLYQK
ncbi:hypothetical protein A4G20_01085 [Pasteurellaceae bacterium RH1A]|nr:hypothetical protein A4G20_01085 [Pasteurellaceae bacterium RH1A]